MTLTPVVADLYHGNAVNFIKLKAAGILGIVHKARQGVDVADFAYPKRREAAESLGFLWAAYDFATHDNVADNVAAFFTTAAPGPNTGMVLDFEDNSHSQMTGDQAWEFLDRGNQKLGRGMWIYGGNRIREHIDPQDKKWIDMAKSVLLWQCRYIKHQPRDINELYNLIRPIPPWTTNFMIQYAADGFGPPPHQVPGVEDGADLSVFNGTVLLLGHLWPGLTLPIIQPMAAPGEQS